jgi:hypothetical protein
VNRCQRITNAKYIVCISYTLKNGKDSFYIAEMARINGEKTGVEVNFRWFMVRGESKL